MGRGGQGRGGRSHLCEAERGSERRAARASRLQKRLHDACIESGQVAGAENRSRMCADAETLLVRFYEAMIEAEPEGDWTTRRDVRFGS